MNTPRNIASASLALQKLVQGAMPSNTQVTTLTPAQAERFSPHDGNLARLNLALYQVSFSSHVRNMLPVHAPAGPAEARRLPLDLHYLVTAYGSVNPADEHSAERLLEAALRIMENHPVLSASELAAAFPDGAAVDPKDQVTIIPNDTVPLPELLNLFAAFRAEWRPALAYVLRLGR